LFDSDGLGDDILDSLLAWSMVEVREEEASEVRVKALVSRNQLIGEGQARHQTALLKPEDGSERAGEEDTLDSGKGDKTLSKGGVLVLDPLDGPIGFLADTGDWKTR